MPNQRSSAARTPRTARMRNGVRGAGFLLLMALTVTGCSMTDPYIIPPLQAARPSGPIPVSICYNSWSSSEVEVRALIAPHCVQPKLVSDKRDLAVCPLSQPVRALFECQDISADLDTRRDVMKTQPAY